MSLSELFIIIEENMIKLIISLDIVNKGLTTMAVGSRYIKIKGVKFGNHESTYSLQLLAS